MPTHSTALATAFVATCCLVCSSSVNADNPVPPAGQGSESHAVRVTTGNSPAGKKSYLGVPYHDPIYHGGPQVIPGRLQNEYYDTMDLSAEQKAAGAEEGITYHDTDKINSGSGTLNGKGSYEKEFRMFESPDISYIKFDHAGVQIDDSPFNRVKPEADGLYLGWIAPGEWVNYTVVVKRPGTYSLTTSYTSKFGGHISFDSDGMDVSGPIEIPSTFDQADPIEWRQAHHWNKVTRLGKLRLKEGVQVLTLHFIDQPVMNFDYMEFVREE
ncbi:MAG: carbohydrate-binding protein [Opitutus sp.]